MKERSDEPDFVRMTSRSNSTLYPRRVSDLNACLFGYACTPTRTQGLRQVIAIPGPSGCIRGNGRQKSSKGEVIALSAGDGGGNSATRFVKQVNAVVRVLMMVVLAWRLHRRGDVEGDLHLRQVAVDRNRLRPGV